MFHSTSGVNDRGFTTELVHAKEKQSSLEQLGPRFSSSEAARGSADSLTRRLQNRHIQLIAIGGSIGTALFLSIGGGLNKGGPGSLFIAYTLYSIVLGLVNNCIAEMTVYMPVSGGFIRLAGKWVDDSLGFMAGWNFFLYEALLIPFEISALSIVLTYWRDDIPTAAVCGVCIAAYIVLNIFVVEVYGEAEFWLAIGKVFLIVMLYCFTFVTMVGGNPQHDAYGFRYWKHPGSFAEHLSKGALGRLEGFLAALWSASFTVVGPEYISMVAAEAKHPRIYIKNAFKTVYWRFGAFFILGSLCCGIVVAYNDPVLAGGSGSGTAAASPYVIAMENLGVDMLPHIVNALLFTSIFSAGNTYCYCATHSLYGLALEGRAPKILTKCWRGNPLLCFCIVICFPFLSFLSVSNGSNVVLTWLVNLVTAGGIINYIVITTTYICFYRACKAQGFDRTQLPYVGYFQPYCAYIGLTWMTVVVVFYGYSSFRPWSVQNFFTYYTMAILAPILFVSWKLIKRTSFRRPHEVDLVWESEAIREYEALETEAPVGFWAELMEMRGPKFSKLERSNVAAV
ncbi:amino acid permease [Grosmannia clavigera kw1407]|uniref:Amino acid permease n=1 Tax=Grosmannia clavigera (strain kw1407 / UAMH 11150) TaxID=655863 RepID=F0XAW4_GROCL|nr:amino acid permease [Grosmannia clavigera kw1407]EFX05152.1 amino acid permease [Grosmannia clavigera kw1407]